MPDELDDSESQPLQRKLSTILSADVAEFSRLMGEDEEGTLKTFRGHKQVFESLVALHRGRIFNTAGDAILAEFGSAVEAVRCATDIQSALRTRNDQLEPSCQVRFRIGVNLGDVMVQGQDLLGDGVNVAARLQTAAEPGGICISGSVHDQIRDKLSLSFRSLGEKSFKNIQQPVRTFSIAQTEGGALPTPKAPASSGGAKWAAAALVLLALAGGGYWARQLRERGAAKPAADAPPTPESVARAGAAAQPSARPVEPGAAAPASATPRRPTPHGAIADRPPVQDSAPFDGPYAGPVCYGRTDARPERCYRASGSVGGGKITGQWAVPHEPGVTMYLTGEVARSGEVKIEMHSQKSDGTIAAVIDLAGAVHGRLLAANGAFRNGRAVTLTWRERPAAAR
jgi:class 3 adenylate cyclase